jgi:negative regulator of flagellin synthesis FlgM
MDIKSINAGSPTTKVDREAAKSSQSNVAETQSNDQVSISQGSNQLNALEQKALSTETIRNEKIQAIKAQIEEGSYQVDIENVAEKIIKAQFE